LDIKWTQQHGMGENPTTHSQVILQFSCEDQMVGLRDGYPTGAAQTQANGNGNNDDNDESPQYMERTFTNNGQNQDGTNTIPDNEEGAGCTNGEETPTSIFNVLQNRKSGNCDACEDNPNTDTFEACEFGMNEDYYRYNQDCRNRARNKGLYSADRKLNRDDASSTRQNPNGARSGLECPEERDYYPYWHPTPWIDVAVLTSDTSWCTYYQQESQNVKAKWMCDIDENTEAPIEEQACVTEGGQWVRLPTWSEVYDGKIKEPDCVVAPTSPQNSLGFTEEGADYSTYGWTIPDMPGATCVLRMRYNISTEDYPSMAGFVVNSQYDTNDGTRPLDSEAQVPDDGIFDSRFNCPLLDSAQQNGNDPDAASNPGTGSTGADAFDCYTGLNTLLRPRYNRPEIHPFGDDKPALSIALNTDQSGRTFQDRSFVFKIIAPPAGSEGKELLNLNVIGKRGNIVQSYPAVEYAFAPHNFTVTQDSLVNLQIHGSDFNNEKNPNNGEGWKYSDRSNFMEMGDAAHSFPGFYNKGDGSVLQNRPNNFLGEAEAYELAYLNQEQLLLDAGGYECLKEDDVDDEQNDPRLCGKLNFAPHLFQKTLDMSNRPTGTFEFISTRNNNFSNRDHKMSLNVVQGGDNNNLVLSPAASAGLAVTGVLVGIVAVVAVVVVVIFMLKGKSDEGSPAPSSNSEARV